MKNSFIIIILSKKQQAMKNAMIEIQLQIKENQKFILMLTPQNYRNEFKQFIHQHSINPTDAYYIKNLIQAKMINLYKGITESVKKKSFYELEHTVNQSWHEGRQSPKFGKIAEQKQVQTLQLQPKEEVELQYFKKNNKQSKQSLVSTNMPSLAINSVPQKIEEHQSEMWLQNKFLFKQEEEQNQFLYKHIRQQSSPCITTSKKKVQDQQKTPSTKYKTNMKEDSMTQNFNRLYEATTESFRNKKNDEINLKEYVDYLEVEKYWMNQNLKRTTREFFNHLHNTNTASFTAKHQKEIVAEKQVEFSSPPKKASLSKCFKGSKWSSGSRCEMKIMLEQQKKLDNRQKRKQLQIKKRIKQKSQKKSMQNNKSDYKSRSCQKCNPKTPQKKKIIQSKTHKIPEPIKTAPRPYINNLLVDSYNQFTQQFSHF